MGILKKTVKWVLQIAIIFLIFSIPINKLPLFYHVSLWVTQVVLNQFEDDTLPPFVGEDINHRDYDEVKKLLNR